METVRLQLDPSDWLERLTALRSDGFAVFDWLTVVDETDREPDSGFDVLCAVMAPPSVDGGWRRLIACTRVGDGQQLPSLTGVWPGVAWHEREAFEMFGVRFNGFDDGTGLGLRRLLLAPDLDGTPLRKSFVLAARVSSPWPGAIDPGQRPSGRRRVPLGVPTGDVGGRL